MRSTATRTDQRSGRAELTLRSTARRQLATACRPPSYAQYSFGCVVHAARPGRRAVDSAAPRAPSRLPATFERSPDPRRRRRRAPATAGEQGPRRRAGRVPRRAATSAVRAPRRPRPPHSWAVRRVQQQGSVESHPPQHRQDGVESLGKLTVEGNGDRREHVRRPPAPPRSDRRPERALGEPLGHDGLRRAEQGDPLLDASRRDGGLGAAALDVVAGIGLVRHQPRQPGRAEHRTRVDLHERAVTAGVGVQRAPRGVVDEPVRDGLGRREPVPRAPPGPAAPSTTRGRRGPAARAAQRPGGGVRRAAPPPSRGRPATRRAPGAPRGRRPGHRVWRTDRDTPAPPAGTARADRPSRVPATRGRSAAPRGSAPGQPTARRPVARPPAAPPAGPARRRWVPVRSRPSPARPGPPPRGRRVREPGGADAGTAPRRPPAGRRPAHPPPPAHGSAEHPVTRGARRRKVAPSSE